MAEKLLKEHLYGDLLAPTPGYSTDFALGMTYSLSFEALLTAHITFGMLGEMNHNVIQSQHLLLNAINKSSDKVVVFCNKGGIKVPPTIRKVYSLMERNIFEVFDREDTKANFHPKLWLIRETNNNNRKDALLKLIVTSRNLAYTDTIDCIACLTGKIGTESAKSAKNQPLIDFIRKVVMTSNIGDGRKDSVLKLAEDLKRIEKFDVEEPFDDYDFFPYLFRHDFGIPKVEDSFAGFENIIISPFIDKTMLSRLNSKGVCKSTLITRKEYVDKSVFDLFKDKGGVYVTLDDLASRGMDLHAKMYYLWDGRDNQYLYLGSANATTSAFGRNGEFLLRLKYRHGNSRASEFLSSFYEKNNSDSKFMPLFEPKEQASATAKWDVAEMAMKDLMCTNDLKARITRRRDSHYVTTVTSSLRHLQADVFIAPMQKKGLAQRWTGRVTFDDMQIEELSEFYILSAVSPDGIRHESIVKIDTTGMPSGRDKGIFNSIIKKPEDFFKILELMLTDAPLRYMADDMLYEKHTDNGKNSDKAPIFPNLYEKMLKISAINPEQIREIGRLAGRLKASVLTDEFIKVYKMVASVIK